jgi:hypothetical protein
LEGDEIIGTAVAVARTGVVGAFASIGVELPSRGNSGTGGIFSVIVGRPTEVVELRIEEPRLDRLAVDLRTKGMEPKMVLWAKDGFSS